MSSLIWVHHCSLLDLKCLFSDICLFHASVIATPLPSIFKLKQSDTRESPCFTDVSAFISHFQMSDFSVAKESCQRSLILLVWHHFRPCWQCVHKHISMLGRISTLFLSSRELRGGTDCHFVFSLTLLQIMIRGKGEGEGERSTEMRTQYLAEISELSKQSTVLSRH